MQFTCDQCEYESNDGWAVIRCDTKIMFNPKYLHFIHILFFRYHCFPCDYTLCSDCARDIEALIRGSLRNSNCNKDDDFDKKLIVFYP